MLPAGVALHARPAAEIARVALGFEAEIRLEVDGRGCDAKSALMLMALGAEGGAELTLRASGADAVEAVARIGSLIEGFRA